MRRTATSCFIASLALAGCATRPMPPPSSEPNFGRTIDQPFRDLSLIREVAPEVLQRAAAAPYAVTDIANCSSAGAELAQLDAALGPDLAPGPKSAGVSMSVQGLAADLIGGAISLPFRGVVRWITRAEARDQALRAAILAGMVRRGFLKGRLELMQCSPTKAAGVPAG